MDETIQRRQMLVERLLVDVLGLPWSEGHREADRLAVAVSDRVEGRISDLLRDPGTCPHGNPIPGSRNVPDQSDAVPLGEALGVVRVTRIAEILEEDLQAMRSLESCGMTPGKLAEIREHSTNGTLVIGSIANARIPHVVASRVYVTPARVA